MKTLRGRKTSNMESEIRRRGVTCMRGPTLGLTYRPMGSMTVGVRSRVRSSRMPYRLESRAKNARRARRGARSLCLLRSVPGPRRGDSFEHSIHKRQRHDCAVPGERPADAEGGIAAQNRRPAARSDCATDSVGICGTLPDATYLWATLASVCDIRRTPWNRLHRSDSPVSPALPR